jgi:arylsulfatase A-like enzyme|eukprot:COSAG06_NODE_1483_length_9302_cov_14.188525_5_plen_493_part_00
MPRRAAPLLGGALMLPAALLPVALSAPSRSAPLLAAVSQAPLQCNNESIMVGRFWGMDGYKIVAAASAAECCGMCASEIGKCRAWTYGHNDAKCHLKSEAPGSSRAGNCEAPCAAGPPGLPAPPPGPPAPPPGPAPVPPQPAGKPTGPNILLLFPDQWRYDWDGFTRENQPDIPGPMLRVPTTRKVAAAGTRFTTAYVPAPVCAPSRSCLASGREYGSEATNGEPGNWSNVISNGFDYPVGQTTFYDVMRARGYHVMTTGKDDLTKASQLGSKLGYPGCPECQPGDGQWHQKELGFSDALRYSGKMDVVQKPVPHEMYGFFLQNHTVHLANGSDITGWQAHRACMGKASKDECINTTFTPELYEDDFTAVNAIKLLQRAPEDKPWFLHVSFPGPHDPFLVTTDMRNAASDGRAWPDAQDNPKNGTPGGACAPVVDPTGTRTRCNYAAEIENLDRLFQLVLDQVESMGQTESTVVCIASDHGEMLGDHGDVDK